VIGPLNIITASFNVRKTISMIDKLFHDSAVMTVSSILPVGIEQHSCVDTIRALYLGDSSFKH